MTQREQLAAIAHRAMIERGLEPDFPAEAMAELGAFTGPSRSNDATGHDLRDRPWCSIDNDDSRDLDQITVAEQLPRGAVRVLVAIADVDGLVAKATPLDLHAQTNTTSVYTAGGIFPMLPERLSTDLTSLGEAQERDAVVFEYLVQVDGGTGGEAIYAARVKNAAKLAYNSVAAWLDGTGPLPEAAQKATGMADQLRLQDRIAQALRARRLEQGALEFESLETNAVFRDDRVENLERQTRNRATELIEELMVAANQASAYFLAAQRIPALRRVVRTPEHWDRLVAYAKTFGETLPGAPDSTALSRFLAARRKADPLRFPDLSLAVVKMMGRGEYVVEVPGEAPVGHFALGVREYMHSTAPNRRFPDLITQRMLKAALGRHPAAYGREELEVLAGHCTAQEDAAEKVARQLRKSAAALLLQSRVGDRFDALVTGAAEKGTWVRCLAPPVEGKLVHGEQGLAIGDRVRVKLIGTDVERGFIDFVRVG
jgi:VacB/RNase II family 3'-5' exoribonuclease